MQQRTVLTDIQINQELMSGTTRTPLWYVLLVLSLGLVFAAALAAVGYMFSRGVGILGLNRPVMWGFLITNFVFWVGISHAGVMISAILRLTQAEWRRPVTRAAEVLTIFALGTAATMPLIHAGRPWRIVYWIFPYDFSRGIWPDIRSPLIWDPAAISTYLSGTIMFVFVAMLPDLAVMRDHIKGPMRHFYRTLAMGWMGTPRQWKLQAVAGILLSGLILPVFVSVHSIVSWDFAVSISVEGWHATVFAPYFVIGAVHSGVSAVVTMMALMKWGFKWDNYIRTEHFDALGRLLAVVGITWMYFFFLDWAYGFYTGEAQEIALREMQLFNAPWGWLFVTLLFTAFFIPIPLWFFRSVRRNVMLMFITSILVNIGMWMEQFLLVVPSLARKTPLTFDWVSYGPTAIEWLLIIGTFAMVGLGVLVFSKVFPLIPIWEQKEGQVFWSDVEEGGRRTPGIIKD